jgi:ketosteroid isomerase-like protein
MEAASQQRNAELAREGMEAYNRGDFEVVLELFSPEVEVYAPPTFMNAGRFHGHQGFMEWIAHWNEAWESFEIHVQDVEPVGDRFVVLHAHQVGLGRGSGVPVEQNVFYAYDIRDGQCVELSVHPDRAAAMAHLRDRETAT